MLGAITNIAQGMREAISSPLENEIRIVTNDGEHAMVSDDGSLVSCFEVHGVRKIVNEDDLTDIIKKSGSGLQSGFENPGRALELNYYCDPYPAAGRRRIVDHISPSRIAAQNIGLELGAMFDAQERYYGDRLVEDRLNIAIWSRPALLSPVIRKKAKNEQAQNKEQWLGGVNSQAPHMRVGALRNSHKAFVSQFRRLFQDQAQTDVTLLTYAEAMRASYESLYPRESAGVWSPRSMEDEPATMVPERHGDPSALLWPLFRRQIVRWESERIDWGTERFGRTHVASVDMTVGPMDVWAFYKLRDQLVEAGVPFRCSMKIESGGDSAGGVRAFFATILTLLDPSKKNWLVAQGYHQAKKGHTNDARVRFRASFATWASPGEEGALKERHAMLLEAVAGWGNCNARGECGDPRAGALSSVFGINMASTAPMGVPSLSTVLRMFPWHRTASPFRRGSLPFLTEDSRLWPFDPASNLLEYRVSLIMGKMGSGKSVLIMRKLLAGILSEGMDALPFGGVIDIGHGSGGLADTVREALPPHLQHLVDRITLQMDDRIKINPFDTMLGCRRPWATARGMCLELLLLVASPADTAETIEGLSEICALVLEEMYARRDDQDPNASPHRYSRGQDPVVDAALERLGLTPEGYWYRIGDQLFLAGDIGAAERAQRRAVPILQDALDALTATHIAKGPAGRVLLASGERLIDRLNFQIGAVIEKFPMLNGVTTFQPGARFMTINLQEVVGKGESNAARHQTAIMYMLASFIVTRGWWCDDEEVRGEKACPTEYLEYHVTRAREMFGAIKILAADEIHEAKGVKPVKRFWAHLGRTGRKHRIELYLGSQLLDDFDADLVKVMSDAWLMDGTPAVVKEASDRFDLSPAVAEKMRERLGQKVPGKGAPVLAIIRTKRKMEYQQLLYSLMGPVELWAMCSTKEDVRLRRDLVAMVGYRPAINILAARYQNGSAEDDVERRIQLYQQRREPAKARKEYVLDEIIEELAGQVRLEMAAVIA